jgi:hypothetical protein
MPIPGLDVTGLLPDGVHDCSLDELRERFGMFQTTDWRPKLFEKLQAFVRDAWKTNLVVEIIIDGSFVTATPRPNDIDLILVLPPEHDFSAELRPFEYNVLSRRQVRRIYSFDVLVTVKGSSSHRQYLDFFAQVRGQIGRRKGLLRLQHDRQ